MQAAIIDATVRERLGADAPSDSAFIRALPHIEGGRNDPHA